MKRQIICAVALTAAGLPVADAYTVVTDQHVDLTIEYSGGVLSGSIRGETGSYGPNDALLYDGPSGTTSFVRPAGPQWDFIGVPAGENVYIWTQSSIPNRMFLGFGSDGGAIAPGTLMSYFEGDPRVSDTARWAKISLVGMRYFAAPGESGPGHFSLWQVDGFGDVSVWAATSDGVDATDATWLVEGGHAHYNWGFTKRGYYQVDLRYSGFLASNGSPVQSSVQTFHFGVEFMPAAIPEPSGAALLAFGACGILARRRRISGMR